MKINEIYSALSGEGVHANIPVTIVRLYGCNLDCRYCDSKYSRVGDEYVEITPANVVAKTSWKRWALITGGEPLLQGDLWDLVHYLGALKGIKTEVETNGSIEPPWWWKQVTCWSADIKCPSSGMCGKSKLDWLGARPCDQVKFVVSDEEDLEFAHKTFMYSNRISPTILISPAWPWTNEWLQRCAEFCLQYEVRLSLQQHKILYGDRRGV